MPIVCPCGRKGNSYVETKSKYLTDNNGTFCCVPTAPYRLVSLDVFGDGRKARNDSDKHAEMFKSDKQFIRTFYPFRLASLPPTEGGFTG